MDSNKKPNLFNNLSSCLQGLESHKVTERRAKRQEILQLLENTEVIQTLNTNSSQKLLQSQTDANYSVITWKSLLNCCHSSLILDVEKEDTKRQKSGIDYKQPNLENSSGLLKDIIKKANKEQPYLSGNDLLKCIYDVSQNYTYQLFMGEVYYKILEQNILSQSYYWHSLSGHWNNLFSLACTLYSATFANMKHVSIKIMKYVVLRGDAHSNVALTVKKKIFPYLKQAITDTLQVNNDCSLREDLISLVFVVCKTIGAESRKSLCQFIEENCTHFINFYENNWRKKIQEILYQLLTIFIKIHHPKCISFDHKASYIFNKKLWITQLNHIYEFVHREIQLSKNNSNPNFSNYISELAVTIFQIEYYNNLSIMDDECPTPKRKKIVVDLQSFIGELNNLTASELCNRLNIITNLLEIDPLPINKNDYINLLLCITKCLSSYKDTNSTKHLIICCKVLIKSENINLLLTKSDSVISFLKTVWPFTLKIIVSNDIPDLSHCLIQSLILLNNWHTEMYSDVLRPYFNKTVKIDNPSLNTLIVLFKTRGVCNVSLNKTNMLLLLDWLFPINVEDDLLIARPYSKIDPYLLSELVYLLLTKSSINNPFINHNCLKTKTMTKDKDNDFLDVYFYMTLQSIPKVHLKVTEPQKNPSIRRITDGYIFQRLIDFIEQIVKIEENPCIVKLQLFFSLTNFLCTLESQFPQLNDQCDELRLFKMKYMQKIESIVSKLNNDVNQQHNEEFINACLIFYKKLQFSDSKVVNSILTHDANKVINYKMYNLSKLNDSNNMYQVLNYDSLTNTQKLSINSTEALLNACVYRSQILSYQTPLLEILVQELTKLEDSICQPYTYFKLTNFCHSILSLENLPIDMIIKTNKFIKQLAKSWYFHQNGFICVTQLLCETLNVITKNNSNKVCTTNLLMIIYSLQKVSNSQKCGPTMICAFVDLLGNFASKNNGSFGSTWNIDTDVVEPMSPENILYYINSPYLQVRVSVIKYIQVMCYSYEINPNSYTISYKQMFDIILQNIHKGFIVDSNISEEEHDDEYTNRIATYLLCIQSLLISSKKFRKICLYEILQTMNDKNIDLNLVTNLLESVAVELNITSYLILLEHNLSYVLWNWHLKYSTFKEFPFRLYSCSTIQQFLKKYSYEIVPILVIKNDLSALNSMGNACQVIEENFSCVFSYLMAIKVGNVPSLNYDKIKHFIEINMDQKSFSDLIKFHFSDILLKCIQMVVINSEKPIIPIQICSNQFLLIAKNFQETHVKSKNPFLTVMSKRQPKYIQIIVHSLFVNVLKKSTSELRCQSFFQYTFFMKILIDQLTKCKDIEDIDEITQFFVNQSVQSTFTLINQNNFEAQYDGLEYLEWVFINTQRFVKLNINQIQALTTSTFRTLAKNQPLIEEKLLHLLNILKQLNNDNNHKINYNSINTLHKDIDELLFQQEKNADIIPSLKYLKLKLKTDDISLQNMYEELLKMRGFSEDCVNSTLHRLICSLIQLTKGFDSEVQILAASCLGVLGPADLTTLILQPEPEILKLKSNTSAEYSFIKHTVIMLLNYLSDENVAVMEASNITLLKILETREGQSLKDELDKSTIYPFIPLQVEEHDIELLFDIEEFNSIIDVKEIWCPEDISITYNDWITRITKHLLEILPDFCKSLLPIAQNKPLFCENILPHLLFFILVHKPLTRHILSKHLNCFFTNHYQIKMDNTSKKLINSNLHQVADLSKNNIYYNKSALQCLLNIINFIRLQQKNPLQKLLDINYLYVSQAAQFCSAHFTSILYSELWCEIEFKNAHKDHWSMVFNPVDIITEMLPEDGLFLQSILNESYKSIGDSDAIEGCGSSHLLNLSSRTQYYQLLKKWDRVMENCDLQLTTGIITKEYLEAFSNSGLHNVAHLMASNNDNYKYDYCWQLDKWNLPDNGNKSFESLHYHALKYVHQKDIASAISMINEARLAVIEFLSCASLESTATIYTPLAKLKMIDDLEDFISTPDKNKLFENWLNKKSLKTNDFVNINKILSQRSKLMEFDGDKRSGVLKLNIAEVAKKNNCLQEAGQNLATIVSLQKYDKHTILWANLEEARILWQRNDCHMARILLKFVVEELDINYEYPFLHSLALQLYGSWIEETKSETASNIIKKYFQKAIKILQMKSTDKKEFGLECKKVLSDAHQHLSQYTDTLYQQISKHIKTEDLQKRIHEVEYGKKKGQAIMDLGRSTNNQERLKAGRLFMNQCDLDESDISKINEEKIKYLKIALQNYLQLMTLDDESELPIYRVISLWLENKENNEINAIVDKEFNQIPSFKFIMVLPQLVPHLNSAYEHNFHKSLENLLNRCAIEHPYHTIPVVYAVANSNIDQQYTKYRKSSNNKEELRVLAAERLMSIWKKDTKINCIVTNTEQLYKAFIHLAYTKLSCSQGQRSEIPMDQPLMKIQYSDSFMYPAATLPLNKLGHYSNIISIKNFRNSFLNAGGIHQPKKIDCLCSDGITRSLLLKSNEDMRQDSVMQQVFVLMNRLLQSNNSTAKRKLTIRTYKVIPFSQQSGIAEWCENTVSLGDYLVGKNYSGGAHQKYRPDDMLPLKAKQIIKISRDNGDSQFARLKQFLKICEELKPVFRYYFFEKFLPPSIWFERRQAYIHSVATTSMVGYILGIGDRHVQNILIDNNTAELVHIDFGIAFDQGTLLPTPENVPFRLSRDIVDGMGICGIEGTYRKCCEKSMSVLRQNQDVIVTVIEVLLYDPCYQWALTEEKAAQLQDQSEIENSNINNSEVNKLAERSLNKIRVKLCGMEEAGSAATINGQVNRLIQQARDPTNLSVLFNGWQAYL